MSKTPARLYAWDVIAKHLGLTTEQSSTLAAALGIADPTDATGTVFGDVSGSLLGPLIVRGLLGYPVDGPPEDGKTIVFDTASGTWLLATPGGGTDRPYFYPEDYGALGGATNDTTAVQDCLDAAAIAGNPVWLSQYFLVDGVTKPLNVFVTGPGERVGGLRANSDSINIITNTGLAFEGGSVPEIDSMRGVTNIRFDVNGHTGVVCIGNIGIAYYEIAWNRFIGAAVAIDNYGSLQYDIHHNQFQDCDVDVYNHAESIGYRGTTPPNKVRVANNNHEGTKKWAVKHSGGAGLLLRDQEYDLCGTTSDLDSGCVLFGDDGLNDEFAQGIDSSGGWAEGTKGYGVVKLAASSSGHSHSIRHLNVPVNNAAHVVGVDGSGAGKHIVLFDDVQVAGTASNRDFYRTGSNVELWFLNSRGALAGSGGIVVQAPLLDGSPVFDLSQLDALRLPGHTTTERDAIASPAAGDVVWNTTTSAVNVYTGSAWTAVGGSSVSALDDLSDVTITSPASADRLRWNGSAWVNSGLIWAPVTVLDPASGNYLVLTDTSGNAIMAEV